jgi:ACS family glucarate transporter-like MFS transporter
MVITMIARMNLSIAARYIQIEFSLDNMQVGYILSAYAVGYALFQIPGGLLADGIGTRATLAGAILWWSLFTFLTASAPGLTRVLPISLVMSFFLTRFMVGVGEAATIPSCNKIVAMWMSPNERGRGNSFFLTGIGVGGAISPPLMVWLMSGMGWEWSFLVCAMVGIPIAGFWWWYGRNRPDEHDGVNSGELAVIRAGGAISKAANHSQRLPTRALFRSRSLWALIVSYCFQGYVIYVFYAWFYLYIVNVRHFSAQAAGYWAAVPFIATAVLTPIGGIVSDRAVQKIGPIWGRRLPVMAGTFTCGILLFTGARIAHPQMGTALIGCAAGCLNFALGNWWATINDTSPHNSGKLGGVMNTAANLGGVVSPILTPFIAIHFGWIHALDFAAIIIFASGALWMYIQQGPIEGT